MSEASLIIPSLDLKRLNIQLGTRCLVRDLDWQVYPQERWVILGANGCGKSSLLAAVAGLPLGGRAMHFDVCRYAGQDMPEPPQKRLQALAAQRSFCPQTVGWNTALTPLQLARLMGVRSSLDVPAPWLNVPVSQRSGGEQQRVAIALTLALNKPIFMADEPLSHLDEVAQHDVLSDLAKITSRGKAVIMVSHHLRLSLDWASHVLLPVDAKGTWLAGAKAIVAIPVNIAAAYSIGVPRAQALMDGQWQA